VFKQTATALDSPSERGRIAEILLRSAGRLIVGHNEREIVRGICETLTQASPHLVMAWTWFGRKDTPTIAPQVCAGAAADYARRLVISRNLLTERGPAFRALDGQRSSPFKVSPLSPFGPWRQAAMEHGVRTALALPLPSPQAHTGGLFVLYADVPDYFEDVGVGLFEAVAELLSSVLTLAGERHELEHAAHHDALTGLLNRHAAPMVGRRLLRETAFAPPACVLLLDLDHFKRLNDTHGHAAGDAVLKACAASLKQTLRRGDEALRWGGEEFLVTLPGSGLADAMGVAEKLRASVSGMGGPAPVTCSMGVAELAVGEALPEAVARADLALYRAKSEGRDRVMAAT
jgi:diguanylate cyclase (GGDEF)-like protein